jgi:hypothetical protein
MTTAKSYHNYATAALENEVNRVAGAQKGQRSDTLNKAVFALAPFVREGSLDRHVLIDQLQRAAEANGHIAEDGIGAVRQTILSGLNAGLQRNLRALPDHKNQWRRDSHPEFPRNYVAASPGQESAPIQVPRWTPPDMNGKPEFLTAVDLPAYADEIRRHYYRHRGRPDGEPVLIKIKKTNGRWEQWFRVQNDHCEVGWQPKKPSGYLAVPYTGSIDLFAPEREGTQIAFPEGEKDVDTLTSLGFSALTFGGASALPAGCERWIAGREVIIFADNDHAGRDRWIVESVIKELGSGGAGVIPQTAGASEWEDIQA